MSHQSKSFWRSPKGLAALGLIGAASYFLLVEHRQHLFEWLPFLILALCPLMHFFMHGGHGHARHRHGNGQGGGVPGDQIHRHDSEESKRKSDN